jgi:uncharacterized protein YjbI with pentapeptide repeats
MDERWAEIRAIWKQNHWLYILVGFLLGVLLQPFLQYLQSDIDGFLQNLVPEAIGIVFTVLLIDRIYQRREQEREKHNLKARLIRELGSRVNEVAKRAAEELLAHKWFSDGSLIEINLQNANLEKAFLEGSNFAKSNLSNANLQTASLAKADLSQTWMTGVNLKNAILHGSNLEKAYLATADMQNSSVSYANLKEANLIAVNLEFAILEGSNLQASDLRFARFLSNGMHNVNLEKANLSFATLQETSMNCANLRNADFTQANLKGLWLNDADLLGAKFNHTQFDINVTLPDGNKCTPETDMRRFTDPTYPEFWRSDDPSSPAYRGKKKE